MLASAGHRYNNSAPFCAFAFPQAGRFLSDQTLSLIACTCRGVAVAHPSRCVPPKSPSVVYIILSYQCIIQTSPQLCLTPHMLTTQRYNPPRGSIVSSSNGIDRLHNLHAKHSEAPASRMYSRVLIKSLRKTEKVGLRLGRVCAHHGPRKALPLAGACCSNIRPHASKFDSTSPVII